MGDRLGYGAARAASKALRRIAAVLGLLVLPAAHGAVADDIDILALGDSLTQGYGLPQDQGLVPQLRDWLSEHGHDVRIVNGGVSGDTSAGGLARVEWSLTPEIDAMIVALGGNDVLRGIDPATTRANIEGILQAAEARSVAVLLVGLDAPGNYGPDYKASFDRLYPDLAEEYGALLVADFFEGIRQGESGLRGAARFMQPDGIHPNAEGVARIVDALGPEVAALIDRVRDDGVR